MYSPNEKIKKIKMKLLPIYTSPTKRKLSKLDQHYFLYSAIGKIIEIKFKLLPIFPPLHRKLLKFRIFLQAINFHYDEFPPLSIFLATNFLLQIFTLSIFTELKEEKKKII